MSAGLDLARLIIDEHRPNGPCPRAAAILLRQHLEATMARERATFGGPPPWGVRQRRIWLQVSRACHADNYQPPSAAQLREWADAIAGCQEVAAEEQAVR